MPKKTETHGIGLAGVLGVVFIALKLAEVGAVARWSWLWVLSPFWIPLSVVLTIVAGMILVVVVRTGLRSFGRGARMRRVMGRD